MNAYGAPDLNAINDPTRLAILRSLAERPLPVSELATEFPISRPAISQHLRVLSDAGLVSARKQGTQRIYSIDPDGLRALKAHFDQFWNVVLSGFKAVAEAEQIMKEEKHVKHRRTSRGINRRV